MASLYVIELAPVDFLELIRTIRIFETVQKVSVRKSRFWKSQKVSIRKFHFECFQLKPKNRLDGNVNGQAIGDFPARYLTETSWAKYDVYASVMPKVSNRHWCLLCSFENASHRNLPIVTRQKLHTMESIAQISIRNWKFAGYYPANWANMQRYELFEKLGKVRKDRKG